MERTVHIEYKVPNSILHKAQRLASKFARMISSMLGNVQYLEKLYSISGIDYTVTIDPTTIKVVVSGDERAAKNKRSITERSPALQLFGVLLLKNQFVNTFGDLVIRTYYGVCKLDSTYKFYYHSWYGVRTGNAWCNIANLDFKVSGTIAQSILVATGSTIPKLYCQLVGGEILWSHTIPFTSAYMHTYRDSGALNLNTAYFVTGELDPTYRLVSVLCLVYNRVYDSDLKVTNLELVRSFDILSWCKCENSAGVVTSNVSYSRAVCRADALGTTKLWCISALCTTTAAGSTTEEGYSRNPSLYVKEHFVLKVDYSKSDASAVTVLYSSASYGHRFLLDRSFATEDSLDKWSGIKVVSCTYSFENSPVPIISSITTGILVASYYEKATVVLRYEAAPYVTGAWQIKRIGYEVTIVVYSFNELREYYHNVGDPPVMTYNFTQGYHTYSGATIEKVIDLSSGEELQLSDGLFHVQPVILDGLTFAYTRDFVTSTPADGNSYTGSGDYFTYTPAVNIWQVASRNTMSYDYCGKAVQCMCGQLETISYLNIDRTQSLITTDQTQKDYTEYGGLKLMIDCLPSLISTWEIFTVLHPYKIFGPAATYKLGRESYRNLEEV